MKKRTAVIGAILSLIPLGQPLIIKTGVAISSSAVILSLPKKVNAGDNSYYFNRAYEKAENGFKEEDVPNFFGSGYSVVKGFTDKMMNLFSNVVSEKMDFQTAKLKVTKKPLKGNFHWGTFITEKTEKQVA